MVRACKDDTGPRPTSGFYQISSRCVSEVVQPTLDVWDRLKDDIMPFQKEHFDLEEEDLIGAFRNPDATIVVLQDTKSEKVVGFTYAEPVEHVYRDGFHSERERLRGAAYIQNTALEPSYIGYGLVGRLTGRLEAELIEKSYKYLERDAIMTNGYAAKIQKTYDERILFAVPHMSRWGEQVFFRIALVKPRIS